MRIDESIVVKSAHDAETFREIHMARFMLLNMAVRNWTLLAETSPASTVLSRPMKVPPSPSIANRGIVPTET